MKARDSHPSRWSEADVDSLLTDFFRAEVPAALRQLPAPSRRVSASVNRERGSAGFKGLTAAACALLLAVTALSPAGRNLVSPDPGDSVAVRPTENQDKTAVAKTPAATVPVIVETQPPFRLPRELRNALPPELRPREDNAAPVTSGDGDPLDLRELLRIEVFEPRDASKTRRVPRKRPRLPEER